MRASYAVFAELRAQGITAGFKDLGAGGLAGCSAELCAAGGMGAEVDLDRVSTAQRDLPPEVIAIGETQERLCWIVPPSFTPTLLAIYNEMYSLPRVARGACAAVIGKVTETGRYVARHRGEIVMDVDLEFLTGGVRYSRDYVLPRATPEPREAREPRDRGARRRPRPSRGSFPLAQRCSAHRDVCSRAPIYRRYDGVVRGCTAIPPGYRRCGRPRADPRRAARCRRRNRREPALRQDRSAVRAAELAVVEAIAQRDRGRSDAARSDRLPELRRSDDPRADGRVRRCGRRSRRTPRGASACPSSRATSRSTTVRRPEITSRRRRSSGVSGRSRTSPRRRTAASSGPVRGSLSSASAARTRRDRSSPSSSGCSRPRCRRSSTRFAEACAAVRDAFARRRRARRARRERRRDARRGRGDGVDRARRSSVPTCSIAVNGSVAFRAMQRRFARVSGLRARSRRRGNGTVRALRQGARRARRRHRANDRRSSRSVRRPCDRLGRNASRSTELREAWEAPLRDFYGSVA